MLLTITTTHKPATDLGYLLHKHPDKLQSFPMTFGKAHVFYPEANEDKCSASLLLEVDPIGLVRHQNGPSGEGFALENYVNDRPYVTSSFMSVAIAQVFGSALNGTSKDRPAIAEMAIPLEVSIDVASVRGGQDLVRNLFEPLGYSIEVKQHILDEQFPDWGVSRYCSIKLTHTIRLSELLSHLYILFPVMDNDKHYWISEQEIEKLKEKGAGWLESHPKKDFIVLRYLKHLAPYTRLAFERLLEVDDSVEETVDEELPVSEAVQQIVEKKISLHQQRLNRVAEVIKLSGASSVLDLGCGEGKLLRLLLKENQFTKITGMDVSFRSLKIASDKLRLDRMPPKQRERIELLHSALTYKDDRLKGFDAAAVVEVIEHLDAQRLESFEKAVFQYAQPGFIALTTPNAEYNVKYETLTAGKFRHSDHRFEWTRAEFESWANRVAEMYGYSVSFEPLGEEDEVVGGPSQMALFEKTPNP